MPKYSINFAPAAAKQLRKFSHNAQVRIGDTIDKLANNPFPQGYKKLVGQKDLYRVRVGDYRIVYKVYSGKLLILIVRIGHRKDAYDF